MRKRSRVHVSRGLSAQESEAYRYGEREFQAEGTAMAKASGSIVLGIPRPGR